MKARVALGLVVVLGGFVGASRPVVADPVRVDGPAPVAADDHAGMPDVRVELAPADVATPAVCRISGTGRPDARTPEAPASLISSDRAGKTPLAVVGMSDVQATFSLSDGSLVAHVVVESGGVRVDGYEPIDREEFRLSHDALALDGHVRMRAKAPVEVAEVHPGSIGIRLVEDVLNVGEIVGSASCSALAYDPSDDGGADMLAAADGANALPRHAELPMKKEPGGDVAFVLRSGDEKPLTLGLTVLGKKGNDVRVALDTYYAHFDVWVDASEVRTDVDEFSGEGRGYGISGGISDGGGEMPMEVREDTDVLVGPEPRGAGPPGLRLLKGARVRTREGHGGWARVFPVSGTISPVPGAAWWVPWRRLHEISFE